MQQLRLFSPISREERLVDGSESAGLLFKGGEVKGVVEYRKTLHIYSWQEYFVALPR